MSIEGGKVGDRALRIVSIIVISIVTLSVNYHATDMTPRA